MSNRQTGKTNADSNSELSAIDDDELNDIAGGAGVTAGVDATQSATISVQLAGDARDSIIDMANYGNAGNNSAGGASQL